MALSQPRSFFGVHSYSPYSRSTGLFYGTLKVIEGSNISLSAETVGLKGGSSRFDWHVEVTDMTAEATLSFSEYPDFVFELFAGNAPTANAAETSGSVTTLTNKYGTLMHATTGIASVSLLSGSSADVKFGKFVLKAISSTAVAVYFSSDADIGRGTDASYSTDDLKVVTTLTITSGGDTTITGFGLKLTGGSGAIALTTGDTATFESRPINTGSMSVTIGAQANQSFPEHGAVLMAAKRGNQEMMEIDALRCIAGGLPLGFTRNTWSKAEVTVKMMYDQTADGVYKIRHVKPS